MFSFKRLIEYVKSFFVIKEEKIKFEDDFLIFFKEVRSGQDLKLLEELTLDKSFVIEAITRKLMPLPVAHQNLKSDPEVILEALKVDPYNIRYASADIQDRCRNQDPIVVLEHMVSLRNLHNSLNICLPKNISIQEKQKIKI